MAEGRNHAEWNRTDAVLCLLYNINRDPKTTEPARPGTFNPYADKPQRATVGVEALRVFVKE